MTQNANEVTKMRSLLQISGFVSVFLLCDCTQQKRFSENFRKWTFFLPPQFYYIELTQLTKHTVLRQFQVSISQFKSQNQDFLGLAYESTIPVPLDAFKPKKILRPKVTKVWVSEDYKSLRFIVHQYTYLHSEHSQISDSFPIIINGS